MCHSTMSADPERNAGRTISHSPMRHAMPLLRAEEKQIDMLLRLLLPLSLEQISFYSMRSPPLLVFSSFIIVKRVFE